MIKQAKHPLKCTTVRSCGGVNGATEPVHIFATLPNGWLPLPNDPMQPGAHTHLHHQLVDGIAQPGHLCRVQPNHQVS